MSELEIDKDYIKSVLKQIVDKVHTNPLKKEVKARDNSKFQISCPYCLDSDINPRNYRGNLNRLLFYKCFNCGIKTHFTSMCKTFGVDIDLDTKLKIYDYLDKEVSYNTYSDDFSSIGFKHLINLTDLVWCINTNDCDSPMYELKPIEKNSLQYNYLISRGIPEQYHTNIWQANFRNSLDRYEPVIVFLNRREGKIIGMQVRNMKDGKQRMFHIYNFKDLYGWLGKDEISEGEMAMYNKLSYYYNILNIDFTQKITLFEGYLDSLFYPNSVGLVGTNTETSFFETNDLDVQFFYDNDQTGFNKSNDKIKLKFSVFLWNKMFETIVKNKKSEDPYKLENRIKKVKDLNKLATLVPNPYKTLNLQQYFSKDEFDKIYLPPKKFFQSKKGDFKKSSFKKIV